MTSHADLRNQLEHMLLSSPLGIQGALTTIPAAEALLKELRNEEFWASKSRKRHLSEDLMIRVWAEYRRDLRSLRERIRQRQHIEELLSWLLVFIVNRYRELARVSAECERKFMLIIEMGPWAGLEPEGNLALRDDWQLWVIDWLRDALRDDDLDATPATVGGSQGSHGDDNGDSTPALHPTRKPDPDHVPGIEF